MASLAACSLQARQALQGSVPARQKPVLVVRSSMSYSQPKAHTFVPDGASTEAALQRTTHLVVGAHPDDVEFMAWHPILECFQNPRLWLTGVVASDGCASPRAGQYADYSDQQMIEVRLKEQRHAAITGEYSAVVHLMHSERGQVMGGSPRPLVEDLKQLLQQSRPAHVVTHNLADSHPHHLVVAVATVAALRELEYKPQTFHGGEVWRGLDWLTDHDKMTFDVSSHQNLTAALMGVFDSQITGGKRYDLATAGRKRANATYHQATSTDQASVLEFGMNATRWISWAS
jgi:LmbE family N-acetylglucosaminyl deacetylase